MQETPQQYTQRILGHSDGKDPIKLQQIAARKFTALIKGLSSVADLALAPLMSMFTSLSLKCPYMGVGSLSGPCLRCVSDRYGRFGGASISFDRCLCHGRGNEKSRG